MARRKKPVATRWDEDNAIRVSPAVIATFAVLGALLAGLFLLFAFWL